jgi:hypothetical protein
LNFGRRVPFLVIMYKYSFFIWQVEELKYINHWPEWSAHGSHQKLGSGWYWVYHPDGHIYSQRTRLVLPILFTPRRHWEKSNPIKFYIINDSFGLKKVDAMVDRVRELNPRVQVQIDATGLKTKDASHFQSFQVVLCTGQDQATMVSFNEMIWILADIRFN